MAFGIGTNAQKAVLYCLHTCHVMQIFLLEYQYSR